MEMALTDCLPVKQKKRIKKFKGGNTFQFNEFILKKLIMLISGW